MPSEVERSRFEEARVSAIALLDRLEAAKTRGDADYIEAFANPVRPPAVPAARITVLIKSGTDITAFDEICAGSHVQVEPIEIMPQFSMEGNANCVAEIETALFRPVMAIVQAAQPSRPTAFVRPSLWAVAYASADPLKPAAEVLVGLRTESGYESIAESASRLRAEIPRSLILVHQGRWIELTAGCTSVQILERLQSGTASRPATGLMG